MFSGVITALITPFRNGKVDHQAYRKLIDFQFANGITGIVPCGTTGESPTLSYEEHNEVVRLAVEFAAGRGPVIAGTGANSVTEAIELTQAAEAAGATGSLQVCPYYNKPNGEGLYHHFKAVANSTKLPIMLYNVPGRCGVEIPIATTKRLVNDCPNIVSIKEANGRPDSVSELVEQCGDKLAVLSGDDGLTLPFMSVGARGVVSVAGNLIPRQMSDMVAKALAGDFVAAAAVHRQIFPLMKTLMSIDVNPIPIKTAMYLAGHCDVEMRLPLWPIDADKTASLRAAMARMGLV